MHFGRTLFVENLRNTARAEEQRDVDYHCRASRGDKRVFQHFADFFVVALAVAETDHGLRARRYAVEDRVCDVIDVDDDAVCRNCDRAADRVEKFVEDEQHHAKGQLRNEGCKPQPCDVSERAETETSLC